MKNVFTNQFEIDFMLVKEDLSTSFVRMANYVQETSLLHCKNAGFPMSWFYDNKKGFILTGWSIEIVQYPKWGDKITIGTWPTWFKGIVAGRSFEAKNEDGDTVLRADSDWVYMDMNKRKPEKINPDMIDKLGNIYESFFPGKASMTLTDNFEMINSSSTFVKRSDIDSNRHTNNISYITWAVDYVPDDVYNHLSIKHVDVKFHKESHLNDELIIETWKNKQNKDEEFMTVIKSALTEEVHCRIHSFWVKPIPFSII